MATLLQLADQHRTAQDRIRRLVEAYVKATYARAMSPNNAQPLAAEWIARVIPVILAYRAQSEALAEVMYGRQRALLYPNESPLTGIDADPIDYETIAISLRATGLSGLIDRVNAGRPVPDAMAAAAEEAAGAGVRHALNGGRSWSVNAVERDRLAIGWYRVTKGEPCSFCAVLASRGPVYKEDSFDQSDPRFEGEGDQKVHDHCACTLAPIYRRDQPLSDRTGEFMQLWESSRIADERDVATGKAPRVGHQFSGNDALNSFRRRYERLHPTTRR